jgi:hypothetical protein
MIEEIAKSCVESGFDSKVVRRLLIEYFNNPDLRAGDPELRQRHIKQFQLGLRAKLLSDCGFSKEQVIDRCLHQSFRLIVNDLDYTIPTKNSNRQIGDRPKVVKTIRLDADLADWLESQAATTGKSQIDIIEEALNRHRSNLAG